MELSKKRVGVLVEQMFNDHEFWYPYYRLKEAGAEVVVIGSGSADVYYGKFGTQIAPDKTAPDLSDTLFDAIVIPGGYAPDHMRRYPDMVALVRRHFEADKWVAAICHAGWMLASAKILNGKTVTSFIAIRDDLEHAGAIWVDQEVVVDGHLITSRKPDDLPAFMKALIAGLGGKKPKTPVRLKA